MPDGCGQTWRMMRARSRWTVARTGVDEVEERTGGRGGKGADSRADRGGKGADNWADGRTGRKGRGQAGRQRRKGRRQLGGRADGRAGPMRRG